MKKAVLILLFFTVIACKNETEKPENTVTRPNIIFIMADDHAVQAISAYGHIMGNYAPTPNIDRIAKNGAIFNKSYCTNSLCGPSRAVILTGKHSHINGFRQNGEIFNGEQPTLPKILQSVGYETALIGKWHLHGLPKGFDHWEILNDQGNYYNPQFIYPKDSVNLNKTQIDTTAHWSINMGDTAVVEGYATDIITEKTLAWLKSRPKQKPFFLMVHHKAPHRNWMPALRHANLYDNILFPVPETYFTEHHGQKAAKEQQQTVYKDMYEGHDLKMTLHEGHPELAHDPWKNDFGRMTKEQRAAWDKAYQPKNDAFHKAKLKGKELALWKAQRYFQEYMATIASVDEGVGKILDYLEATGMDKNTLVVYTSDQGFYLGEKGWFDKRFMYEESFRMPLLMQFSGKIKAGRKVEAMVQNLDFAPTFLDFAGASQLSADMQGKSFKNILIDSTEVQNFKDVIYYHYYDYPAFHMVKKHYGIRTKQYKLMHFYDDIDAWEFYDLEKDPMEMNNLYGDTAYTQQIKLMHTKLDSVQKAYGVTNKEFEKAPKERVEKAYENFKKLRGQPIE